MEDLIVLLKVLDLLHDFFENFGAVLCSAFHSDCDPKGTHCCGKQCIRLYKCLFCAAKCLLGTPQTLSLCTVPMQAAHSCGTLLLRVNAHSPWKFRMLFGVSVNGAVMASVVKWMRCVPDTRKREDGCRDGTALPDARWGTLHEISGRKRRTESSVYLLFAARQTVQLHLQNHGWSPAVVRGLARNTRSLLYKLKKTAENRP